MTRQTSGQRAGHGVIFEMLPQGRFVKVSAICTVTGLEVSIVGDPTVPTAQLKRIAGMKLQRMLDKKKPKVLNSAKSGIIV